MRENVKVESCVPKVGKTSNKPYYHLNGKIFIHDKAMGRKLEDNVGKTFVMEIDRTTDFVKVKEIFEETKEEPIEVVDMNPPKANQIVKQEIKADEVVITKAKPNSYECGKTGNRVKLYFDSAEDLQEQIKSLKDVNLMPEEVK